MRKYQIETLLNLPFVDVVVSGPKRSRRLSLVFDTGATLTQIHTTTLKSLGYSWEGRQPDLSLKGVSGLEQHGFSLRVDRLFTLGTLFRNFELAAFDFSDWVEEGIDGLLGFDAIRRFDLHMDGPAGLLTVF
jgi:hypothetical protein